MFLTDAELQARLAEFAFAVEDEQAPFDPGTQIGPCSIDLRLSRVYWTRQRARNRVVDLERTQLMELAPTRGWQRHELRGGDKIVLKPGEMVLGRIAENFQIPSDCAGYIEGRSSFARLGLSVHATGGFINPGWRGHMPLTLVNHSPVTLRIPVGTPLCQLLVVRLDRRPDRDYADRTDRKYINDEGAPSVWWRDTLMTELRKSLSRGNVPGNTLEEIDELLADGLDEDLLLRLEDFVEQGRGHHSSADGLLDAFAAKEKRRKWWGRVLTWGLGVASTALTSVSITYWVHATKHPRIRYLVTGLAVVAVGALLASFWGDKPSYLDPNRLRSLRGQRERKRRDAQRKPK